MLRLDSDFSDILRCVEQHGWSRVACRGLDLTNLSNLLSPLGNVFHHPDAEPDGVTQIIPRESSNVIGQRGFGSGDLFPHTDASWSVPPPRYLFSHVTTPAVEGGESTFFDAYDYFNLCTPQELLVLSDPKNFHFISGEMYLELPVIFKFCGVSAIRFRNDGGMRVRDSAKPLIERLVSFIDSEKTSHYLEEGDAYLLDNWRILHGRKRFKGDRRVKRILLS